MLPALWTALVTFCQPATRSIFPNYKDYGKLDIPTTGQIVASLKIAREILEEETPNFLLASSLLDIAEEYLVWIVPNHLLKARITYLSNRLNDLDEIFRNHYIKELNRILEASTYYGYDRAIIDEIVRVDNRKNFNWQ